MQYVIGTCKSDNMEHDKHIHRIPRFKRKYQSVFSYRAELLYGRRFSEKLRTIKRSKDIDDILKIMYENKRRRSTEIRVKTAGAI